MDGVSLNKTRFSPGVSQWDKGDDSSITVGEVTEAVKQVFGGRALGVDEVHSEFLKALDVVMIWIWRSGGWGVLLDWQTL